MNFLIKKCENVKHLRLDCAVINDLQMIILLKQFKNLEILDLSQSKGLTQIRLSIASKLKELKLGFSSVKDEELVYIIN
jgi:hypothetical protein